MASTSLFGLALAPLFSAIAQVESGRGATSENVYQIRVLYVLDVNRIVANARRSGAEWVGTKRSIPSWFMLSDRRAPFVSEMMMTVYWEHYGKRYIEKTGEPVTYEVLARIHNGGPNGWMKSATVRYWKKVREVMDMEAACAK